MGLFLLNVIFIIKATKVRLNIRWSTFLFNQKSFKRQYITVRMVKYTSFSLFAYTFLCYHILD